MKTVTVRIADRDYEITALTIKPTKAWQLKAQTPVNNLFGAVETLQGVELNDVGQLVGLAREVATVVMGMTDIVLDLVCDYAPNIAADRAYIEDNGYNEEVMSAFLEVLKMVYPLAALTKLLGPRKR